MLWPQRRVMPFRRRPMDTTFCATLAWVLIRLLSESRIPWFDGRQRTDVIMDNKENNYVISLKFYICLNKLDTYVISLMWI
jgi:hypothetical protein